MTFDPMTVEVTCVTLPKDHCVQVPWQYINVCGYSDQFCKIPHTYIHTHTTYILHTYYVQNEWSHSLLLNSVQARQKLKWCCHRIVRDGKCVLSTLVQGLLLSMAVHIIMKLKVTTHQLVWHQTQGKIQGIFQTLFGDYHLRQEVWRYSNTY